MKITIDNIINFMKEKQEVIITDEQVEEIKNYFYEDVENLVYWSFTEINRYYEIKLEGLISKEYYNRIKSDLYKDKNYIAVYKSLLWFLLGNNTETIFDDDIFIDKMTDIRNKIVIFFFMNIYIIIIQKQLKEEKN